MANLRFMSLFMVYLLNGLTRISLASWLQRVINLPSEILVWVFSSLYTHWCKLVPVTEKRNRYPLLSSLSRAPNKAEKWLSERYAVENRPLQKRTSPVPRGPTRAKRYRGRERA